MIGQVVHILKYGEGSSTRGLAARKTVVNVSDICEGDKVFISTPRTGVDRITPDAIQAYRVVSEITDRDQLCRLACHTGRERSTVRNVPILIKIQGGGTYISTRWEYDTDNKFRFFYGDGSHTNWDRYLHNTNYSIYTVETVESEIQMTNVQSPNKDKTFRSNKLGGMTDLTLFNEVVSLNSVLRAIEAGAITIDNAVALSAYTKADLESGLALLQNEVEFRANREALEELARVERELEELKSREEKQKEALAKKERLLARVGNLVAQE